MRARTIKPGFWDNEDLAALPAHARLLFIGIWGMADRDGRLEDRPARIRAKVFPYEPEVEVDRFLTSLHEQGFIMRYEVAGIRLIEVPGFKKHQNPHPNEKAYGYPAREITRVDHVITQTDHAIPSIPSISCFPLPVSRATHGPRARDAENGTQNQKPEDELPSRTAPLIAGRTPHDWATRLCDRHPKAKNRVLAEQEITKLCFGKGAEALLPLIDSRHEAWCATEAWQDKDGQYAPALATWLTDRGWTKQPKGMKPGDVAIPKWEGNYWEREGKAAE